jgi:hypothetical protein
MSLHRAERFREPVMRLTASDGSETWVYQYPKYMWKDTVRRIMADVRDGKLPSSAAEGLLGLMEEAKDAD